MLLVADIGNTSIAFGAYKDNLLMDSWRLSSNKDQSEDEYGVILSNLIKNKNFEGKFKAAIIASVVLPLTEVFKTAIEQYIGIPVIIASSRIKLNIGFEVDNPRKVGCDRIANACAAFKLYKPPIVVVDFGTATTFDIVSTEGNFIGGIIAPGIGISAESLSSFTNLLPKIKLMESPAVIGKNTIDNMLSGLVRGHAAMIDGLIVDIEQELKSPVTTVATGGYSKIICDCLKRPFDYSNHHLTLEGLNLIYNLNKNQFLPTIPVNGDDALA